MGEPLSTRQQAEGAVTKSRDLYLYGQLSYSVYMRLRTGLENGHDAAVVELWQRTAVEQAARLRPAAITHSTQVAAWWHDIEPVVRAWVAEEDTLTEQDWQEEPESTRERYASVKALLAQVDAENAENVERGGQSISHS